MSSGSHILIKKIKGKEILEIGHYEAEIVTRDPVYCLTKPWRWGGLTSGGTSGWTIFNLKTKDEIAQFTKKEDAVAYYKFLQTRQ